METSFRIKLVVVTIGMAGLLLGPYFLWHEQLDAYFGSQAYQQWLISIRPYAWLIGVGLLVADMCLPIPAPPVMAALGVLYGPVGGGAIAAAGSFLAGLLGYSLACLAGRRGVRWLASEEQLVEFQEFFNRWGAVGIIASRGLPVLPEVLTVLAGLARMRFRLFMLSLAAGSIATGMAIAWAGHVGGHSSTMLLGMTLGPGGVLCGYLVVAKRQPKSPCGRLQGL